MYRMTETQQDRRSPLNKVTASLMPLGWALVFSGIRETCIAGVGLSTPGGK